MRGNRIKHYAKKLLEERDRLNTPDEICLINSEDYAYIRQVIRTQGNKKLAVLVEGEIEDKFLERLKHDYPKTHIYTWDGYNEDKEMEKQSICNIRRVS